MIYITVGASLLSVISFLISIKAFRESRKLNNKWKMLKRTKSEENHGFKIVSC